MNNIKIIFNRPLVFLSFFLISGIMFSYIYGVAYDGSWVVVLVLLALLIIIIFEKATLLIIGVLIAFLGSFLYGTSLQSEMMNHDLTLNNISIVVEVLNSPMIRRNALEADVRIKQIRENDSITSVNEKAKLKVNVNVNDEHEEKMRSILSIGSFVRVNEITTQRVLTEPAGYELHLKSKNIHMIIETNCEHIQFIRGKNKYSLLAVTYVTKEYVELFFDNTIQRPYNELIKSILFGNQGYMPKEMISNYSKSGTAHIIAVSGLHIGIIVLILGKMFEIIGLNKNNRLFLIMLLLFAYSYALNFPTSVIRAGAMYFLYVVAYFTNRRYDSINSLFLIAIVVLMYNPLTLFSVSFQLSFMATFSILIFYPVVCNKLNQVPDPLKKLLAVSISAQIGTLPIIAYHFNHISLISLIANLFIVPTMGLLISLAIISVLMSVISFHLASFLSLLTNGLLIYIGLTVSKLAELPFSSIEINDVNVIYIIAYYTGLVLLYYWTRLESKKSRKLDCS